MPSSVRAYPSRKAPAGRGQLRVVEHLLAHHFGLLIALFGEVYLVQKKAIERSFPSHQQVPPRLSDRARRWLGESLEPPSGTSLHERTRILRQDHDEAHQRLAGAARLQGRQQQVASAQFGGSFGGSLQPVVAALVGAHSEPAWVVSSTSRKPGRIRAVVKVVSRAPARSMRSTSLSSPPRHSCSVLATCNSNVVSAHA